MRSLLLLGAVVVLAVGGAAGWIVGDLATDPEVVTSTTTATRTTTATTTVEEAGLPTAVEETRRTILDAADSGDYDTLRGVIPSTGFTYTFGGPVEGGPIAYWREYERSGGQRPLAILAAILRMPYTLSNGVYVWPWAYSVQSPTNLRAHERELLEPLGTPSELFVPGTGYLGWRAGIEPDGTWVFFVAGD